MTFKEGLLKARGQLTFIVALAISTGIIIYLETLDTEERIQSRVATEVARQRNAPASIPPALDTAVRRNLQRSEEAYAADPGAAVNRAVLLVSLTSAVQTGILAPQDGLSRVERILSEMERRKGEANPLLDAALGAAAIAFPSLQERIANLNAVRS